MSIEGVLGRPANIRDMVEVPTLVKDRPSIPGLGLSEEFMGRLGDIYAKTMSRHQASSNGVGIEIDNLPAAVVIFGHEYLERLNPNLPTELSNGLHTVINSRRSDDRELGSFVDGILRGYYAWKIAYPDTFELARQGIGFQQDYPQLIQSYFDRENIEYRSTLSALYMSSEVYGKDFVTENLEKLWPKIKFNMSGRLAKVIEASRDPDLRLERADVIFDSLSSLKLLSPEKYAELGIGRQMIDFGLKLIHAYFEDEQEYQYARFQLVWNLAVMNGDIFMGDKGPELIKPEMPIEVSESLLPQTRRFS